MMKTWVVTGIVLGALVATVEAADLAANAAAQIEADAAAAEEWAVPPSARALMHGTEADSQISGAVDFVETGGGLQVVAQFSIGAPVGRHGIHIREGETCDDGGKAAGGHFNPIGTTHGFLPRDGMGKAHAGDMGNIEITPEGKGTLVLFLPGLSLTEGYTKVVGRVVVLDLKEDDLSPSAGHGGSPVACGRIMMNK